MIINDDQEFDFGLSEFVRCLELYKYKWLKTIGTPFVGVSKAMEHPLLGLVKARICLLPPSTT